MKISNLLLGAGWVLLALFLISTYLFNQFSLDNNSATFKPIAWEDHKQLFKGAVQCTLNDDDLLSRKQELKENVFSKVKRKEKVEQGYIFYFADDNKLLADVLEFTQKEKACCPFFKFDISILPYDYGFALQISGSETAVAMLEELEESEF